MLTGFLTLLNKYLFAAHVSVVDFIDGSDGCGKDSVMGYGGLIIWTLLSIYMFVGLYVLCEEYFVPSLIVLGDKMKLSEDVSGATLMAAGSSSPELFTALIGVFFYSNDNPGPSTNCASAAFNLCVIIGLSIILSGRQTLVISGYPFIRDSVFYGFSTLWMYLIYEVITPGRIDFFESAILVGIWVTYILILVYQSFVLDVVIALIRKCGRRVPPSLLYHQLGAVQPDIHAKKGGPVETAGAGMRHHREMSDSSVSEEATLDEYDDIKDPSETSGPVYAGHENLSGLAGGRNGHNLANSSDEDDLPYHDDGAASIDSISVTSVPVVDAKQFKSSYEGLLLITQQKLRQEMLAAQGQIHSNSKDRETPHPLAEPSTSPEVSHDLENPNKMISSDEEEEDDESGQNIDDEQRHLHDRRRHDSPQRKSPSSMKKKLHGMVVSKASMAAHYQNGDGSLINPAQIPPQASPKTKTAKFDYATGGKLAFGVSRGPPDTSTRRLRRQNIDLSRIEVMSEPALALENQRADSEASSSKFSSHFDNFWSRVRHTRRTDHIGADRSSMTSVPTTGYHDEDGYTIATSMTSGHTGGHSLMTTRTAVFGLRDIFDMSLVPFRFLFNVTIPPMVHGANANNVTSFKLTVIFTMVIVWMAFITYLCIDCANKIGVCCGFTPEVMGLTLLAIGSSLPDCFSSILVAKEGKGDMAVSNALGSNVFDLCICVGLSFFIKGVQLKGGHIEVEHGVGYESFILALAILLALLIFLLYRNNLVLTKRIGWVLLAAYVVFLVIFSFVLDFFSD